MYIYNIYMMNHDDESNFVHRFHKHTFDLWTNSHFIISCYLLISLLTLDESRFLIQYIYTEFLNVF